MLTVKTTTMSVLLILQMTVVVAMSLGLYKSCMYECLNCVNTWGKVLFNGKMCAEQCAQTGGRSIDSTCASFFARTSRGAAVATEARYPTRQRGPSPDIRMGLSTDYSSVNSGPQRFRSRTSSSRSALYSACQRRCRTCETRFNSSMDAHACLYTCVRTRGRVIVC